MISAPAAGAANPPIAEGALVVLSGGQDSTTCLFWALRRFERVKTVTFDYGQRHRVELDAAAKIAELVGVPNIQINAPVLQGTSPLVDHSRDVGTYADAASLPGGLEDTFVPGRNILFLTIAGNVAYCHGLGNLVTGVAQEDFGGYPDCRQSFIDAMQLALREGLGAGDGDPRGEITIHTPLMNMTKRETVDLAARLPGCLDAMAYSHTCFQGQVPPCGQCHACLLRAKGFEAAGVTDPLLARLGRE